MAKRLERLPDGGALGGEDGAGQSVGRGLVDDLQRFRPAALRVDVHRDDRTEDLLAHQR
jgi:hypothetical protein